MYFIVVVVFMTEIFQKKLLWSIDRIFKRRQDERRERRQVLAKRFAVKCTKSENFKKMFPLSNKQYDRLRKQEKYEVKFSRTLRLCNSSIPAMQRLLNQ